MQRADLVDFAIRPFCDALQEPVPIVDERLTVGLEEWQRLVLADNRLSGSSPTDIRLVDNRREKSGVILTSVCLLRTLANWTQPSLSDSAQRLG